MNHSDLQAPRVPLRGAGTEAEVVGGERLRPPTAAEHPDGITNCLPHGRNPKGSSPGIPSLRDLMKHATDRYEHVNGK